jgi:hypothetical protein
MERCCIMGVICASKVKSLAPGPAPVAFYAMPSPFFLQGICCAWDQ